MFTVGCRHANFDFQTSEAFYMLTDFQILYHRYTLLSLTFKVIYTNFKKYLPTGEQTFTNFTLKRGSWLCEHMLNELPNYVSWY